LANTIKNKFTAPRLTEFSPKDLVIDVKNGHLYYKSNKSVFKVVGNLFSTVVNGRSIEVEEDLSIGGAEDTQVLFNNNSSGIPIDGVSDFTLTTDVELSSQGVVLGTVARLNVGAINITGNSLLSTINNTVIGGALSQTAGQIVAGTPAQAFFTQAEFGPQVNQNSSLLPHISSTSGEELHLTSEGNPLGSTTGGAIKIRKGFYSIFNVIHPKVEVRGGLFVGPGTPVTSNISGQDITLPSNPGNIKATEDVIAFASDKRLKENIVNIDNPLQKIKQLRGVYFDWKDKTKELGFNPTVKKNEIGMIAQEVEAVIPQAITNAPFDESYEGTDREKYKTIKYDRLIPLLVECINKQQEQIDELKKQIENG